MNSTTRKKFIGWNFFLYIGAAYIGVNLYLNDKLRAEMDKVLSSGKKKGKLLSIHENLAGSYDKKTENFEFRNQFNKYRRVLLSYAQGKVLECGVGTGRSLEFYNNKCNEVIAIDYNDKMLDHAYKRLESRNNHRISDNLNIIIKNIDCEKLNENFPENTFDTVVDLNNFHCYNDYTTVYDNIKRVLKKDGIFIFLGRGESNYILIRDFYKLWRPFVFMKYGQDLTINWSELIDNDKDWEVLFKQRKNYGKTYLYILKNKKISEDNINNNNIKI
jgi:ubiquinone/menaquinone biosynthesis C-methylase UbiE